MVASPESVPAESLVLGIDAGGTKTLAWLAPLAAVEKSIGRGTAGPANIQSIGLDATLANLSHAVDAAFADAGVAPGPLAAAVLAAAGSDRDENRAALRAWSAERRLAARFEVVHDALPVLAAGSPEAWGVALIAGTGSLAFGRARDGRSARSGGWGFLFGDEGSGYAIAVAGLRAAMWSADGRGPKTAILELLLARLNLRRAEELVAAIYPVAADRARIAALADVVVAAAELSDAVAQRILNEAADDLVAMIAAVARRLEFAERPFPLALGGGLLTAAGAVRARLGDALAARSLAVEPLAVVAEPVAGAVRLARALADRGVV